MASTLNKKSEHASTRVARRKKNYHAVKTRAPTRSCVVYQQDLYRELRNIFGPIYTVVQTILRKYNDDSWKPLSDATNFPIVDSSNGDPKTCFADDRIDINIDMFYELLKFHYGFPGIDGNVVTCSQWQKFVGINNKLARLFMIVKQYTRTRRRMEDPDDYLKILFHKPIPCINPVKYYVYLRKCVDFFPASNYSTKYPYFA